MEGRHRRRLPVECPRNLVWSANLNAPEFDVWFYISRLQESDLVSRFFFLGGIHTHESRES